MKFLKHIFGFVWACWGATWFMITVVPFTLLYSFIFSLTGRKYVMHCIWINCHYLSPFILWMCGIRLKVYGKENIPADRTCVFVANHLAQVDIIATAAALPQPIKFLAKAEIRHIPFFGYMTKMLAIMVDRKDKASRDKSVKYMIQELQSGNSIFIYPEGTRNRTGHLLKEFKNGAFRLAISAQVPVAVQTLCGTKDVNSPEGWQLYPGVVKVFWSPLIETTGMTMKDIPALIEAVQQEMLKNLSKQAIE